MRSFGKCLRAAKVTLLLRTLIACLILLALSVAPIPTLAGDAEDKANQAFADWKAANQAVENAKKDLEKAREKQQIEMAKAAERKKKKKQDDAQDKQLEAARAEVAAAEAALEKAEAALVAARVALEKAIAELPEGDLKDKLKRERLYPSLSSLNASVNSRGGLTVVTFSTPAGDITVNLPGDIRAGDTISGTVISDPKGSTPQEKVKNHSLLKDLGIGIDNQRLQPFSGALQKEREGVIQQTFWIYRADVPKVNPAVPTAKPVSISLINSDGKELATTTIPVWLGLNGVTPDGANLTPDPKITPGFIIPPLGQAGRPVEIIGPFDGNAANTTLRTSVQDFEKNTENVSGGFGLIAESPRKAVFRAPANVTGPIEVHVKEGNVEDKGTYRNVGVNLSAPKTTLLKGESTTLKVEVSGLEGIKTPVPLTLESHGVITMAGGVYQPLVIQPSEVGADGRYSTTREITGVQAGGWGATATVVTQPFNIVLRDPEPPQTLLLNSFTGDYVFCGSGSKLTGTGQLKRQGCIIELTDNRPDREVKGTFDSCVPADNGRLFTFYSPGTNTEIKVNVTGTQPPIRKVYFNPLSKPALPVQDVSAFATCP